MALRWLDEPGVVDWLERLEQSSRIDAMGMVAHSARALALVDAARPEAAAAVEALAESRHRDELWALSVFIRTLHVLATGRPEEVVKQANVVRSALRYVRHGSLIEAMLTTVLVDVLLAENMAPIAQEVVQGMELRGFTWIAVARLRLREERHDEAVSAALQTLESSGTAGRYVLEAHMVIASAHYGAGRFAEAKVAFRAAIYRSQQTGQRGALTVSGYYVFSVLAAGDESILELWPRPALSVEESGDQNRTTVLLTAREAQVLHALETHAGPVGIAHALGLSANTAKTHVRAVYRKLGVSNREEALAMARRIMIHT